MKLLRLCSGLALAGMIISGPGYPVPAPGATADITKYLGTRWYGIYLMNQKMGYAEGEVRRAYCKGKPAAVVSLTLKAKVKMGGAPQEMTIVEKRVYVLGEGLFSFVNETNAGGGVMRIRGEVRDNKMRVTSLVGGQETTATTGVPPERFEDYIAEERLAGEGAKVGDTITFSQYQPALQKTITAVSTIVDIQKKPLQGIPTRLYIVETTIKEMGVVSTSVIKGDGEVLQAQVGGVFTMRLEDERTAKNLDYRSDVILSTVIRPKETIRNPAAVRQMKVRIRGVKDPSLLMSSERQTYAMQPGGEALLTVRVEDLSGVAIPDVPMKAGDFPAELAPGLFIQSDTPAIVRKARGIVGEKKNARGASDALVDWVYRNLQKRFSASFSNALDVLASGGGDCTEHSALYVALARAAGLPAREVSGIVYSEDDPGFYYHQWAEAYVGKWIAVDPTFGQPQADATHIKFASGDLLSQARLLNLIGSLGIDILEYHEAAKN